MLGQVPSAVAGRRPAAAARQQSLDGGAVLRVSVTEGQGLPSIWMQLNRQGSSARMPSSGEPASAAGAGEVGTYPCAASSASATADGFVGRVVRGRAVPTGESACSNASIAGLTLVATSGLFPA